MPPVLTPSGHIRCDRFDTDRRIEAALEMGCPHCMSRRGSCHICHGAGRVSHSVGFVAVGWAWPTRGCACDACDRLRGSE